MALRKLILFLSLLVACGDGDRPRDDAGELDANDASDADDAAMDALFDVTNDVPLIDVPTLDVTPDTPPDVGPGCADGRMNGDESDVDCGGGTCFDRCEDGARCVVSSDCTSAVCIGFLCQPPRCSDGIRNGMETGVDCGGTSCAGCGLGEACVDAEDCADGQCVGGFCVAEHCFDGMRNVNETDLDCGGPDCGPCSVGLRCAEDTDCMMGTCITGFCRTAACTNGVMDPGEAGIDCGGECPGCSDGAMCTLNADCLSLRCEGMTCTSCEDDTLNGDETDIDCGGSSCPGCFGGETCITGSDCASGTCTAGRCDGGSVYYEEDFATGDGGWSVGGSSSSWEYATPATASIMGAFTGTRVWVTNATGDYNVSETSWVESPSFDLTGVTMDPVIELAVSYQTESCCDEIWLELSTNGGATWTKIGEQGDDWYNDSGNVWAGSSSGWRPVTTELSGASGFADVKVRIYFDADFSVQDEGFAFDDVVVREDICNNGVHDASESDVDCGGTTCAPCPDGSMCVMPTDCGSMICEASECISCLDGIRNGDELAIDCGGPTCGLCPGGTPCSDGSLCASGDCVAGMCTTPPFYYEEDFESTPAWRASGGSWEHGAPSATVIDSAASGTNAWVTNLTGDYMNGESSYIESPRIDLGGAASDPVLTLSLNYVTESCCDEGWVEVSTDDGMTYTKLVGSPAAMGWYNDTSNQWWDGGTGGWNTVSTVLTGTARESRVRIRVHFSSDSSVVREGFGIDDVRIAPPAPNLDVQVVSSTERCDAAAIQVTNVGSAPVSFFDLTTNADGVMSTTTITVPLEPGESYETTVVASMTLEASVSAAGDPDPSNDTASVMIPPPIPLGARYLETFEASGGGWLVGGVNASWEHGEPDDSFISNADSGMGAWVTGLDADHLDDEDSTLTSPCFDMSATLADVNLSFSRIFDFEPTHDHAHVEFSIDGGLTWNKLGAFGEGTNWYNDLLGDFWDGVSGAPGEWRRADIDVPGSAGAALVRFRFVVQSNDSLNEEGIGVDDVIIVP